MSTFRDLDIGLSLLQPLTRCIRVTARSRPPCTRSLPHALVVYSACPRPLSSSGGFCHHHSRVLGAHARRRDWISGARGCPVHHRGLHFCLSHYHHQNLQYHLGSNTELLRPPKLASTFRQQHGIAATTKTCHHSSILAAAIISVAKKERKKVPPEAAPKPKVYDCQS